AANRISRLAATPSSSVAFATTAIGRGSRCAGWTWFEAWLTIRARLRARIVNKVKFGRTLPHCGTTAVLRPPRQDRGASSAGAVWAKHAVPDAASGRALVLSHRRRRPRLPASHWG